METMVATVLIVVIFMIASLIMNSLMAARNKSDLSSIQEHLKKIEYLGINQRLELPYSEVWKQWEIIVIKQDGNGTPTLEINAQHELSEKELTVNILLDR